MFRHGFSPWGHKPRPRPPRCQIHKARNIQERLPKSLHASVRRVLRQAWELDDADKAEKLLRNLARRLERDWAGVAGSILEGDEILTVTRLGLPDRLRRSLACTNMIENVMGTVRRVCRNVKRFHQPPRIRLKHITESGAGGGAAATDRRQSSVSGPAARFKPLVRQADFCPGKTPQTRIRH
jgi:hypothetical protein